MTYLRVKRTNPMKNVRLMSITFAGFLAAACILSVSKAGQSAQVKEAQKILDATGIKGGLVVRIGKRR